MSLHVWFELIPWRCGGIAPPALRELLMKHSSAAVVLLLGGVKLASRPGWLRA